MKALDRLNADARVYDAHYEAGYERGEKGSYWVSLMPGFVDTSTEMHLIHEDTIREVLERIKHVEPCACTQCIIGGAPH